MIRAAPFNPGRALADDELLRHTGQTAVRDVATAERLVAAAEEALRSSRRRARRHERSGLPIRLRYWNTLVTTGSDLADSVALGGFLFLVYAIPVIPYATLVIPLIIGSRLPAAVPPTVGLVIASSLSIVSYSVLKTAPDERGKDRDALRKERYRSWRREREALTANAAQCAEDLRQKRRLLDQLRTVTLDAELQERNRLLCDDIPALRGQDFERFLERVFRSLGYRRVAVTKGSGDQGIDIIVEDGKERVSIQAKGCEAAVSNKAVQEAVSGRMFYGCDRCAVITNSVFTKSAEELAARTACKLIDYQQLRRLIAGKEAL